MSLIKEDKKKKKSVFDWVLYKECLVVDESSLQHKEFRDIYFEDKTTNKRYAHAALLIIFMVNDLTESNPLKDIRYDEKEVEANKRAMKAFGVTKFTNSMNKLIPKGHAKYASLVSSGDREVYVYDKKLDQLSDMLKGMEPVITKHEDRDGSFIDFSTNTDIINKTLDNIVSIIMSKSATVSANVQGVSQRTLRGKVSPLASGKLMDKVEKMAKPKILDDIFNDDDDDDIELLMI